MILALGIGFGVLTLALAFGLDGIRKEAARSANAQIQIAEALGKSDHCCSIDPGAIGDFGRRGKNHC